MKKNKILPHSNNALNLLRVSALGLAGFYLLQSFKKEGSIKTATLGRHSNFNIDTKKITNAIMPHVPVDDTKKEAIKSAIDEFFTNLKHELFKKDDSK